MSITSDMCLLLATFALDITPSEHVRFRHRTSSPHVVLRFPVPPLLRSSPRSNFSRTSVTGSSLNLIRMWRGIDHSQLSPPKH
jgi:hypothetical protein